MLWRASALCERFYDSVPIKGDELSAICPGTATKKNSLLFGCEVGDAFYLTTERFSGEMKTVKKGQKKFFVGYLPAF